MFVPARTLLCAAAILATAACGPGLEPKAPGGDAACQGPKMWGCERELAKATAGGAVTKELVTRYVAGRAAEDAADPWVKVWRALADRGSTRAAIVDSRGPAGGASAAGAKAGARVVAPVTLPEPQGIPAAELLLAMGTAAGYDHVVWLGAGGGRAYEVYPRDPLGPHMLGLRPVVRDDAAASHLEANLALAEGVRRVIEAAGAFRYADAASEADRLREQTSGRDPFEEPVLRARAARSMLAWAGLTFEAPLSLFSEGPASPAPVVPAMPAPSESDTPYGDLLRVRVAEESAVEWKRRGPRVLAALAEDLRAPVEALFAGSSACGAPVAPPDFSRPEMLALAGLLPGSLAGAREEAILGASPPGLPLAEWYPRYERLVEHVDRAHFTWLHAGSLLLQRGELPGIRPTSTAAYRRVTELGRRHIEALRELSAKDPERYQETAELALAVSPGLLGDPPLRAGLVELTSASSKARLGAAKEPGAIAGTLLAGGLLGLTYPPAIQEAHYLALQSAFAARIKGDLMQKTGWGTALLFAADAIVRVAADLSPNLAFSSEQIARALSDPGIAQPSLAAVASAAARYAALAKDRPLAANVSAAQSTPERGAAREALRKAIAGLGAPGEAPPALAGDITTLADGLIAVLTIALHEKAPPPGACATGAKTAAEIGVEHALTDLRRVREKILRSPSLKSGDGLWARRARLLVTALSDAMDLLAPPRKGRPRALSIPAAGVEAAIEAGLREWDEPGARAAVVGVYSLVRFFLAGDPEDRYAEGGPYLVRALGGLGRFLRGFGEDGLPTILDAFAQVSAKKTAASDIGSALLAYAGSAYEKGHADQGDVFLMANLLISSVRRTPPPPEAIALAAANRSRVDWALSLFAEVAAAETTGRPNVAAFAESVRRSAASLCAPGRAGDVVDVLGAVAQFSEGRRREARAALDKVLARADAEGLVVQRVDYRYAERQSRKILTLSFGLTYGLGFVEGANTFQLGLGFSSLARRQSSLDVRAASAGETAIETARWYVRVAALAAAYHFLDGDAASGAMDARRAVSAIVAGVRLGGRTVATDRARWAEDARALLAIDAQLAADAGLPFLSGDLWTVVRDSLPPAADDGAIDAVLAQRPLGLVGVKEADAPVERARRSLTAAAAPLACTTAKVDAARFEQVDCAAYPLALGLRVADVLPRLPRLRSARAASSASCAPLASLDTFLEAASRGTYDPDAFTRSVDELRTGGREDEAAALLARQRRDGHCSPALLRAARALGRSASLLPSARADMLSVAANCAGIDAGAELESDLAALDAETRKLANPLRHLQVILFAADLALRADRGSILLDRVRGPDFVERYFPVSASAVAAALVVHHAAFALSGEPLDPAPTEGAVSLVCDAFPSEDRRTECDQIRALRDPKTAPAARKDLAKEALRRLMDAPPRRP